MTDPITPPPPTPAPSPARVPAIIEYKLAKTGEVVNLIQQWGARALMRRNDGSTMMADWSGREPHIAWIASPEVRPREGHELDAWNAAQPPAPAA